MSESREMTLREWTMRLPEGHLANKQLTILESSLAQAQADVEALQKHRRALESMLERLAVWFERTAEDELAASVELPSAEKMGAYLRQRLWEEKIDFLPEHLRREGR